jgi:adenylate kinase family enzyme
MPTVETSYAPSGETEDRERSIPAVTRMPSFASVRTVEQFVAVVGPAAVGKSTVTGALADRFGARVFRLREFADEYRERPTTDQRLFETHDPLGWLAEETVLLLLQAAFVHGQFPTRDMVVLENFPGSLTQLLLLKAITDQLRAFLTLIELTAVDSLVAARARARRVCPTCEPDPRGDPHRPARPATHNPDRCGSCGGELLPRRGDQPEHFAARLARFRRRIPAIRRAAAVLQVPYHAVDATCDPDTCVHHVVTALAVGESSAHPLASRLEHF